MSNPEASFEIELLEKQGHDARAAGQYSIAESFFAEAARLADDHADWPTRVRLKYWLAHSYFIRGKEEEALTIYTWLLSLPGDPEAGPSLAGSTHLAYSYGNFVDVGRFMPDMHVRQLHYVLNEAERLLHEIGQPERLHRIRLQRAILFEMENRLTEARQEMEAALALRRRDQYGQGFYLGFHLNELGGVLKDLGEYDKASAYYREVFEGSEHSIDTRANAAIGLASVAHERGDWTEAEHWAREGWALASQTDVLDDHFHARRTLLLVLVKRGKVTAAAKQAKELWHLGGHRGIVRTIYRSALSFAEVRLACARECGGLTTASDELPDAVPEWLIDTRRRALRYLCDADRWIVRARASAQRLDGQAGVVNEQDKVRQLEHRAAGLRAWLERES